MLKRYIASAAALMFVGMSAANAAPITFFGEDINPSGDAGGTPLTSFPKANSARNSFFANLLGVGTETFESIAPGTTNPTVTFPGAGKATITGSGDVEAGVSSSLQYPVSGSNYFNAGTGDFGLNFSTPIAAFGFYGVDVGDFGGQLTLTLTAVGGATSTVTVPNQISNNGEIGGSVIYFGFYDKGTQYTNIAFGNNSGGNDVFGFDNFSVGSLTQVVPVSNIPLPASAPMFGAALMALGAVGYGLKRKGKPGTAA